MDTRSSLASSFPLRPRSQGSPHSENQSVGWPFFMVHSRQQQPSALLARSWRLPEIGLVRVIRPSPADIAHIDETWPARRRLTDWHHSWRWHEITASRPEAFALRKDDGSLLGIWCSAKKAPITLPDGRFYRPDFLEISPDARGREVGAFIFLLIASRALELKAEGIVLGTWPVLREFYSRMGGHERKPRGWNLENNLVPFVFDLATLQGLKNLLDGMEHHGEGTPNL